MSVLDIIKQKGEYSFDDSLNYLVGVNELGDYVCEIDGEKSYCSNCIEAIIKERNAELKKIGFKKISEIHDCNSDTPFVEIISCVETMPERDDFESCNNCGTEIYVDVLFTEDNEIKHWIGEEIVVDELSDSDAYRIYTCITSEDAISKYPKLVKQLKEKLENI